MAPAELERLLRRLEALPPRDGFLLVLALFDRHEPELAWALAHRLCIDHEADAGRQLPARRSYEHA